MNIFLFLTFCKTCCNVLQKPCNILWYMNESQAKMPFNHRYIHTF